jgi:EAL domain-containing protein (putative c-di-GMP-specific phosphodiesterase class I)
MKNNFLRKLKIHDVLFREGDPADCAYIIEQGRLQVSVHKDGEDIPIATLGPGDIFGEMGIIDASPRSATVTALETCVLTTVSRSSLNDRIENSDPIVRLLISILMKRIRDASRTAGDRGEDSVQAIDKSWMQAGVDTLKLETDLMEGLRNREFFLEYQPIFQLETSKLLGYEALLRWQSPDRGLVRPDLFINVAEQTSVIVPMGYWILEQAIGDLLTLQSELAQSELFMSINVSVRQLVDPQFARRLQKIVVRLGGDPKRIKLEVTERVFQENPLIVQTIKKLRWSGFKISLDDFGTGYSSLTSLFNLPVDDIKVDRSFVSNVSKNPKSRAIVQAVIALGTELGLTVVAEGIEFEEQKEFLTSMGCKMGQGFLFSKPVALAKIIAELGGVKKRVS